MQRSRRPALLPRSTDWISAWTVRPFERLRRQFAAVGSGCLDGVEGPRDLALVVAEPQEAPQVRDHVLQRVARHLAAAQCDEPFDVPERQRVQVLVGSEAALQEVGHRHRMVFARRERQAPQFQQLPLVVSAQADMATLVCAREQPPAREQEPTIGTLGGVEHERPARHAAADSAECLVQILRVAQGPGNRGRTCSRRSR